MGQGLTMDNGSFSKSTSGAKEREVILTRSKKATVIETENGNLEPYWPCSPFCEKIDCLCAGLGQCHLDQLQHPRLDKNTTESASGSKNMGKYAAGWHDDRRNGSKGIHDHVSHSKDLYY
jgi:hypothetical protein